MRTKTKLEIAQQHVREAEIRVARQRDITTSLPGRGDHRFIAQTLLNAFELSLNSQKAHLARIEKEI